MITNGTYRAQASGTCVLGTSNNKGTPFIELYFMILDGENKGGQVRWTSYFTEKTNERTIQSLQAMGWEGEDIGEFEDGGLHGLDTNPVDIVVALEEYEDKNGEPRTAPRVQWVNRAGGYLNTDAAMNKEAAQSFGDRMRGLVLAMKSRQPAKPPQKADDSFAFGANAAPTPTQPADTTGKKPF